MALATATITYDLSDQLGQEFWRSSSKAFIQARTNVPENVIVDTAGNQIRLGSGRQDLGPDGTGSLTVWVPGAGSNPASWQTYFDVSYPDRTANGGRGLRTFGPFTLTPNIAVTNKALTSNVATLTTATAHGLLVGDTVTVLDVAAPFAGTFTVASVPTTTTFTYAVTSANIASTATTGRIARDLADLVAQMPIQPEYASALTARVAALEAGGGGGGVAGVSSVNTRTGAVTLTKSDVGLANVDNTADTAKPVSTAQAAADTAVQAAAVQRANHTGTQAIGTVTGLQTALDGLAPIRSTINAQTGTTYTLVLADENKTVTLTNAAAITVTLPSDASVAIPIGGRIDFIVLNTGMATFVAGSGATANGTPSLVTRARYSAASAIKVAANTWIVVGDLA